MLKLEKIKADFEKSLGSKDARKFIRISLCKWKNIQKMLRKEQKDLGKLLERDRLNGKIR